MSADKNSEPVVELGGSKGRFANTDIAIIPIPALGDITIYLRLGWLFYRAGAKVTFYSSTLYAARDYFPWLKVLAEGDSDLVELADRFELVIAYLGRYYRNGAWSSEYSTLDNIAFVNAKKIPTDSGLNGREVVIRGQVYTGASRSFCLDSGAGITMVDWVDNYASEVFGIETAYTGELITRPLASVSSNLVLIFPTTPQPKKNYWLTGFRILARSLQKRGWRVEFVCMPSEQEEIARALDGYPVKSFPDLKGLFDCVAESAAVISNDSGGGHLASMLGVTTFTITRRREGFVWRPGFNAKNTVLYPLFRFKWLDKKYVWRPFVPIWRIAAKMGERK